MAFVALAGSELSKLGVPGADTLAKSAFANIDARFRDTVNGGYYASEKSLEKLANPHMHLLEASICYFDANRGEEGRDRIEEILRIFENHFFDSVNGVVHERLNSNFGPSIHDWIEPGHGLEWAFLYAEATKRLGLKNDAVAWSLVQQAEESAVLGLIPNRIESGAAIGGFRLWPQLERLRAVYTVHPDRDLEALLRNLRLHYLSQGPAGGWIDEIDENMVPVAKHVPASMVYHLITALGPLAAETLNLRAVY